LREKRRVKVGIRERGCQRGNSARKDRDQNRKTAAMPLSICLP
jgi:hypothetical protein